MTQSLFDKLAGISAIFVVMSVSSVSAAGIEKLHLIEHATSDQTAHVGTKPDNRGDVLTFANDVFDAANKIKVGGDQGFCIRITTGKAYECLWTLSLAAGQITVEGPYLDAGDSVLAVTGGTGKYADVRGQLALHARDAKGSEYDFNYTLQHAAAH